MYALVADIHFFTINSRKSGKNSLRERKRKQGTFSDLGKFVFVDDLVNSIHTFGIYFNNTVEVVSITRAESPPGLYVPP